MSYDNGEPRSYLLEFPNHLIEYSSHFCSDPMYESLNSHGRCHFRRGKSEPSKLPESKAQKATATGPLLCNGRHV